MTISSETNRIDFITDGGTTDFDLGSGFQFLQNDDLSYQLAIYYKASDGEQETITTGYSVTYDSELRTGSIIFAEAPATGLLSVIRNVPDTQEVVFSDDNAFPATGNATQLDKIAMSLQEFTEKMNRMPYAQVLSMYDSLKLPEPTDEDDSGKAIVLLYDSDEDIFSLALADCTVPIPDLPDDIGKAIVVDSSGNLVFSSVDSELEIETHKADLDNPHVVTKTQLSIENVDNTSDADKPISDATQDALDLKADISNVLELDNTTAFTPNADYEPATKKYVDDLPTSVNTRQTVLSSRLDANGLPNILSGCGGLSVGVYGSSDDPLVLNISNGFTVNGSSDSFQSYTTEQTISGLTASSTCYIYLVYNPSGSATVGGHTTIAPTYSYAAPSAPSTDDFWFCISAMRMYQYSGSAWVETPAVFIGEVTTDATEVTAVVNYALRGQYDSGWFTITSNTQYAKSHNIGVSDVSLQLFGGTSATGANMGQISNGLTIANGNATSGVGVGGINPIELTFNTNDITYNASLWPSASLTGLFPTYAKVIVKRAW